MHRLPASHDVIVVTEAHFDDGRVVTLARELLEHRVFATHGRDDCGGVLMLARLSAIQESEVDISVFEAGRCIGARWQARGRGSAVVGVRLVSQATRVARRSLPRHVRDWPPHPFEGRGFVGGDFNTVMAGEARVRLQTGVAVTAKDSLEGILRRSWARPWRSSNKATT